MKLTENFISGKPGITDFYTRNYTLKHVHNTNVSEVKEYKMSKKQLKEHLKSLGY